MPDTYPQATWDVPNALLNYAGGFWRDTYTGQQELRAYFAGVSRICAQHDVQVVELLDSMSRHSVKNTRQFLLSPIVLRKSALASLYLQFGQTAEFAQQSTYTFGGLGPTRYAFPAPAGWCSLRSLQQGLQPTTWLGVANLDFYLDVAAGELVFNRNPFEDNRLNKELVQLEDDSTDEVIQLFGAMVEVQDDTAYTHFGAPLGLPNSQHSNYLQFLNAFADSIYCGPAHSQICRMLSAVTDMPHVQTADERVEDIIYDTDYTHVITLSHVYSVPASNTLQVAVGDTLHQGQWLSDAVELLDLRNGTVPDNLYSLTVGSDLLAPSYATGLQFHNTDVDVTVDTTHASGKTFVSFTVGGHPATVEQFWSEVHARGLAQGHTLAELWDIRPSPDTQPTRNSLPATVNPLHFLAQNILAANACIVRIRPGLLPGTGMSFSWLRHVRRALPPHVVLITLFELQPAVSSATLTVTDELTAPTDNQEFAEELLVPVYAEATNPRYINLTCL